MKLLILFALLSGQVFANGMSGTWTGNATITDSVGTANCRVAVEIKESESTVEILKETIDCAGGYSSGETPKTFTVEYQGFYFLSLDGKKVGEYAPGKFMTSFSNYGLFGSTFKMYEMKADTLLYSIKRMTLRFDVKSLLNGTLKKE